MRFNISYMGPEWMFHLRRDFILALQYGLQSLGHDVTLSDQTLAGSRFNLLISAYFMKPADLVQIAQSGIGFAHINTEVIADDTLNFNPDKVDFLGSFLPSMQAGHFVWDVIEDNMEEHDHYGTRAHFLRWGWHPKMQDIEHREKDLDFYFFGMMSQRRTSIVQGLKQQGFRGIADNSCPYFLRNDRIARAKVLLNLRQADKYSHVNSFRICYACNNACALISEWEADPAGYLDAVTVVKDIPGIAEALREMTQGDEWKRRGDRALEMFKQQPMVESLEKLLEESFGNGG